MRTLIASGAILLAGMAATVTPAADRDQPKYTVKQVMKRAHKDGLLKRIAAGQGTKEEARDLLELYRSLGQNKPPKGDPASWQAKTRDIAAAAQDVVEDKPDARARLQKAVNCAQCHKMHKG